MTDAARDPQGDSGTRVSDCEALLVVLQAAHGEYVPNLYAMNMMIHSRVADLRRQGHVIECKRFGKKDYRYRLIQNGGKR